MKECIRSGEYATRLDIEREQQLLPIRNGQKEIKRRPRLASHHGLIEFLRIPLELKDPTGTFQRAMDVISSSVHCRFALIYVDDIVIF